MKNKSVDVEHKKEKLFALFLFFVFHFTGAQTLFEYKKEALENNPRIKSLMQTVALEAEKINEVSSLPNTQIGTGYFVSEPETRTGAQRAKFSIQQPLPWFGTVKSKKQTTTAQTEVIKNKLAIAKRKVELQVETKYYELYELKAKQNVLAKQDTLIDTYIEITLKEVENNRASAVDVLKLNIAKNTIQNQQEMLKGNILSLETAMNQLLHRDGFDPLYIPDNLFIPDEEPTLLLEEITYHPELLTYDFIEDVLHKKEEENAKERMPSIGLGLDYIIVEERPNIDISDNGKDIIMPTVSFSIPIFSKKHTSRAKQYELKKEEIYQLREASQNDLENLMESAINSRISARIDYDTQQKNIEQAIQVEKVMRTSYQTAQLDIEALLDIRKMILDFENQKIEAIAMYFKQTAMLNYLR